MALSERRRMFAQGLAAGMSATDAYLRAFPKTKPESAARNTSRLTKNDEIQQEVERFRLEAEKAEGSDFLTLQEKRNFLARVVRCQLQKEPVSSNLIQELTRNNRTAGKGEDSESWEVEKVKLPDKLKAIALDHELASEGSKTGPVDALAGLLAKLTGAKL